LGRPVVEFQELALTSDLSAEALPPSLTVQLAPESGDGQVYAARQVGFCVVAKRSENLVRNIWKTKSTDP
jgi:hypothetical protein